MAVKRPVFDDVNLDRTIEVKAEDDSTINLRLMIRLDSEVGDTKANRRMNSLGMSKVLMLVDHLVMFACKCSDEELDRIATKMVDR
jgi:hypothetical protein